MPIFLVFFQCNWNQDPFHEIDDLISKEKYSLAIQKISDELENHPKEFFFLFEKSTYSPFLNESRNYFYYFENSNLVRFDLQSKEKMKIPIGLGWTNFKSSNDGNYISFQKAVENKCITMIKCIDDPNWEFSTHEIPCGISMLLTEGAAQVVWGSREGLHFKNTTSNSLPESWKGNSKFPKWKGKNLKTNLFLLGDEIVIMRGFGGDYQVFYSQFENGKLYPWKPRIAKPVFIPIGNEQFLAISGSSGNWNWEKFQISKWDSSDFVSPYRGGGLNVVYPPFAAFTNTRDGMGWLKKENASKAEDLKLICKNAVPLIQNLVLCQRSDGSYIVRNLVPSQEELLLWEKFMDWKQKSDREN